MRKSVALLLSVLLISNRSYASDLVLAFSGSAEGLIYDPPFEGGLPGFIRVDLPTFDYSLGTPSQLSLTGTATISVGSAEIWDPTWASGGTIGGVTYSATCELAYIPPGLPPNPPLLSMNTSSVPVQGVFMPDLGGGSSFGWSPTLLNPTATFSYGEDMSRYLLGAPSLGVGMIAITNPFYPNPDTPIGLAGQTHVAICGSIDYTYTPVPEPAALTLLGTASLSLALFRRRWRKH